MKKHVKMFILGMFALAMLFSMPLAVTSVAGASSASPIQLSTSCHASADAYRCEDPSEIYTEWWYFSVRDSDVFAYWMIGIDNPLNLPDGLDQDCFMQYGFITDTESFSELIGFDYGMENFVASMTDLYVYMRDDAIDVELEIDAVNDDVISLVGHYGDFTWDVTFTRNEGVESYETTMDFGLLWGTADWLQYMPSATVTGDVSINANDYSVNADGYHDHQWGNFNSAVLKPWYTVFDNEMSIDGYHSGLLNNEMAIWFDLDNDGQKELHTFSTITLVNILSYVTDPTSGKLIPSKMRISGNDGELKVVINMEITKWENNVIEDPASGVTVDFIDGLANYDVTISQKRPILGWKQVYQANGLIGQFERVTVNLF